jgi:glutathione peroxidase
MAAWHHTPPLAQGHPGLNTKKRAFLPGGSRDTPGMKSFLLAALAWLPLSLQAAPVEIYSIETKTLQGQPYPMAELKDRVVLFVNVASKCGFTKQYAGLEALSKEYSGKGLVIVGVPSNEFKNQEPGTAEEIATFCRDTYGVTFPLLEKSMVKTGAEQSPLYQYLTSGHGEPKWNFHKYLVGKDGVVIAEYPSKVAPDSPELRGAIDTALAQ